MCSKNYYATNFSMIEKMTIKNFQILRNHAQTKPQIYKKNKEYIKITAKLLLIN